MKKLLFLTAICLSGCAAQTGIVPNGNGGYLITKQAATGFPGLGSQKGDALAEANAFCSNQGRQFILTKTTETQPPYIMGNYPRTEIEFDCAKSNLK